MPAPAATATVANRLMVMRGASRSVHQRIGDRVLSGLQLAEEIGDLRVLHRIAGFVDEEILLGDVRDIRRRFVLGKEVIEGLIPAGAKVLRDRLPPLFGAAEDGIDIEDDAPERVDTVAYDLTDSKLCGFIVHRLQQGARNGYFRRRAVRC